MWSYESYPNYLNGFTWTYCMRQLMLFLDRFKIPGIGVQTAFRKGRAGGSSQPQNRCRGSGKNRRNKWKRTYNQKYSLLQGLVCENGGYKRKIIASFCAANPPNYPSKHIPVMPDRWQRVISVVPGEGTWLKALLFICFLDSTKDIQEQFSLLVFPNISL